MDQEEYRKSLPKDPISLMAEYFRVEAEYEREKAQALRELLFGIFVVTPVFITGLVLFDIYVRWW